MPSIDYDILFSVQAEVVKSNATEPDLIPSLAWQFDISPVTRANMPQGKILFKQLGERGLLLMQPTDYDGQQAVFEIEKPLTFLVEVRLNQSRLPRLLDLGLSPKTNDPAIPQTIRDFFHLAFPGVSPSYVLKKERLVAGENVIGIDDAVPTPNTGLSFDKNSFAEIKLESSFPAKVEIEPLPFRVFENGAEKLIEHPTAFEFPVNALREGIYTLNGKKVNEDGSESPFLGKILLNRGIGRSNAIASLLIELEPGQIKSGERNFIVKLQQWAPVIVP